MIEFEADFAPFQPTDQRAVEGIPTFQYSHRNNFWAGNEPMKRAAQQGTSSDKDQGHGIEIFT
ncbi:MAG: hypothetical protein ACK5MK_09370 [Dysgonomonas sp.]